LGRQGLKLSEIISFTNELFNDEWQAEKAARIIKAILEVHSPRIADIALTMEGDVRTADKNEQAQYGYSRQRAYL
jgi:hypothetical protein